MIILIQIKCIHLIHELLTAVAANMLYDSKNVDIILGVPLFILSMRTQTL